jgi:hypothetical protein
MSIFRVITEIFYILLIAAAYTGTAATSLACFLCVASRTKA